MKKRLIISAMLISLLGCTSCGGSSAAPADTVSRTESESSETESPTGNIEASGDKASVNGTESKEKKASDDIDVSSDHARGDQDTSSDKSDKSAPADESDKSDMETESGKTGGEGSTVSAIPDNYLQIYADFLRGLSANASVPSRLTFQLIYLDEDDIQELVTAEGSTLESEASLYRVTDTGVVPITCEGQNWGNHGQLWYAEHEGIVLYAFTTVSMGDYSFYRVEDGKAEFVKDFAKRPAENGDGFNYYVRGELVPEEEYKTQYHNCGGDRLSAAGYFNGTVVSEESMQQLLNNDPICYDGEGGPF